MCSPSFSKGLDSILKVKLVTMVNGYRGLGSIKLNNRYKRLKHVNLSENEAVTPTTYHQNGVLMKGCINLLSVKLVLGNQHCLLNFTSVIRVDSSSARAIG